MRFDEHHPQHRTQDRQPEGDRAPGLASGPLKASGLLTGQPLRPGWLGLLAVLALGLPAAWGQSSPRQRQAADADYRREVRECESSAASQDRSTCLREARSARADLRRGALTTPSQETLQTNALARCQVFAPGPDMEACRARVMGEGNSSGSVAGGGILREYAVTVPLEPTPAQTEMGAPGSGPRMDTPQEPQGTAPGSGQEAPAPSVPQNQQPRPGESMPQDMHRQMHPQMHPQMQPRMQQPMQAPMQPQMQAPASPPVR